MTTKLNMGRDINGYNGFFLDFTDTKYSVTLSAGVVQSITLPADCSEYRVVFTYEPGASVWVARNSTAELPGPSFAATNSEQNPAGRNANSGDVISFITANSSVKVGVQIYAFY